MRRFSPKWPAAALVLLTCVCLRAESTETSDATQFLRFVDDGHGGGKLETTVARYRNDAGVSVDLVAAVHIGDKAYYDRLNQAFKKYDAVLYEMVKPRDAAPPQPGEERTGNMITVIQRFMKDTLDLKFQLDEIDYTAPNFVHADLDAETFAKMEAERGESIWSLMLQQMLKQMMNPPANQPDIGIGDLLDAFGSPDRARRLKMLLGRQFGDIEDQMSSFGGTVLLTGRNDACFKVLDREIADGKRDLAIFYGAAHMPDMEKRLLARGFHRTAVRRLVAWNIPDGENANPRQDRPNHQAAPDSGSDTGRSIRVEYVLPRR